MRVPMQELITITNRSSPKGQAAWFKKHFDLTAEYDCKGVIITQEAFHMLVSKKYGLAANDNVAPQQEQRPTVRLVKKHA